MLNTFREPRNNNAASARVTFEAPSDNAFGAYAFSGTEEVHRPYEFKIELAAESEANSPRSWSTRRPTGA